MNLFNFNIIYILLIFNIIIYIIIVETIYHMYQYVFVHKRSDIFSAEKNTNSRVSSMERWTSAVTHSGRFSTAKHIASGCQCQRSDQVRVRMERVIPGPKIEANGRLCASFVPAIVVTRYQPFNKLEQRDHARITCNRKVQRVKPDDRMAHDAAFASLTQTPGTDVLVIPLAFGGVSCRK